jgi:hypothetical protein
MMNITQIKMMKMAQKENLEIVLKKILLILIIPRESWITAGLKRIEVHTVAKCIKNLNSP